MANGTLDDKLIAKIAGRLTWPKMCQISVKYMGFDYEDLERIWLDEMKATPSTREALTLYRSKLSEEQSQTAKEVRHRKMYFLSNFERLNKIIFSGLRIPMFACIRYQKIR